MRTQMLRFLVVVAITTLAVQAQPLDRAAISAFEQFTEREMGRDRMTGLSVAVMRGDVIWARGFGFADVENRVPATEKSSYRMASVSKPMTAVAALRLAEMGTLDLDAAIQRYVPYFPDKGKTITTRQLLAHLGGISHYRNYDVEGNIRERKNTREAIAVFEKFDLVNGPGSAYHYSSYGYNLVGAVIEGASGRKYEDVMKELVWSPAGMTSTRLDSPTDIIPNRVTGYRIDGDELKRSDFVDISSRFAAGGSRSTVVDMVRFVHAVREGKLLRTETIDRMWWPAETSAQKWITYGLGWTVQPVNGHYYVAHSGSQQETRTLLMHFPAQNLTIAFASNFEDAQFSRYHDYLYWLLTGEVWRAAAYAGDPTDRVAITIAERVMDAGGFYFEKYGRPMTTDARELQRAFTSINDAFRIAAKDPVAAEKAIADGIHPASGQPLLVAGSWIASKVPSGAGALAAMSQYGRTRQRHHLDPGLQKRIAELSNEWSRVWTAESKNLFIERHTDDAMATAIRRYQGLRIAPSLVAQLVEEAEASFRRGDLTRAVRLSTLAAEMYPNDHTAAGGHGVLLALSGKEDEAETWLRRSADLNGDGYATPRRIVSIARNVVALGQRDRAVTLLQTAARVHPRSEDVKNALAGILAP